MDPFQIVRMGRLQRVAEDRIVSGFAPESLYPFEPLTQLGTRLGTPRFLVTAGAETHIELTLVDRPGATRELRDAIDRVAEPFGLSPSDRFDLKLAATEAVTNALKGDSARRVAVILEARPEALAVEVATTGPFQRQPSRGDEGGRGIPLMLALVDQIEFAQSRQGTRVRMQKRIAA
jgi:serine/threonine-protein kinase RsbW